MIELILRADDIGYSEAINYGIAKTVKDGLIGSAGLMCNMPYAAQGVELLNGTDVCLGQHTNVCLGTPCADPSLIPSLVQADGQFKSSRRYREAYKQGMDLIKVDEAVIEVEAQYIRFKALTGKKPEYFEAHAIASENLQKALRIVANRYDLPLNDMNPMVENGLFKGHPIHALPMQSMEEKYDPLTCLKNGILNHVRTDMPNVFVCHPGWLDQYLLNHSSLTINRTKEVDMLCSTETKQWLEKNNVRLIKYRDIV
ncbi:MAG: ChbG/HpnK family deacetylase [Solobacterium sp.]|nr:ChbG/HpnK family deacetylase [Solobacterium sp.]